MSLVGRGWGMPKRHRGEAARPSQLPFRPGWGAAYAAQGGRDVPGAAEVAYDHIRAAILSGAHAPGTRLLEEDLAAAAGVSRTPVREALRRLDAEGLVEFVPNRGAHVAAWTDHDLEEIFGLRSLLEGYGARLAARKIDAESVRALAKLCDEMEASALAGDLDRLAELNHEFHFAILTAADNQRLLDSALSLVQFPLVHRTFRRYDHSHLVRSQAHHRELVSALSAGDADWAESVMHAHVLSARAALG